MNIPTQRKELWPKAGVNSPLFAQRASACRNQLASQQSHRVKSIFSLVRNVLWFLLGLRSLAPCLGIQREHNLAFAFAVLGKVHATVQRS